MFVPVAILTEVNALVVGFQTRAFFPANDCPSYARTSPVGSRMAFTATMGQEKGAPHWPTRSGVPATTVTETGVLVAVLLLASRATAVRTWFPETANCVPHDRERRVQRLGAKRLAIDKKLNAGNAHIVGSIGGHRNKTENRGACLWRVDRNGWRRGIRRRWRAASDRCVHVGLDLGWVSARL